MRMLLSTGVALLAATPAAAQYQSTTPDTTTHSEIIYQPPEPTEYESVSSDRPERREATPWPKPFRGFDWNKPEPGKHGYFADDYHTVWGWGGGKRMRAGDRIYRGRNLRYYCRRWDGGTQLLDEAAEALLGDALPAGGSAKLKSLTSSGIASSVARGEVTCGGEVNRYDKIIMRGGEGSDQPAGQE